MGSRAKPASAGPCVRRTLTSPGTRKEDRVITIRHTHEDGTLVDGTSKGDGTAEILKAHRFRWFPSLKLWGVAQSRDHLAKRGQIEGAVQALRDAGFEVAVEINDTPRDVAEVKADRADRLLDRQIALEEKAERNSAEADARFKRSHDIAYARNGQPRLAGHHSARAWDADQKRIEDNDRLGAQAYFKGQHYEQAAAVVGKEDARRERPDVIMRRIEKNEADLRGVERDIRGEGAPNNWREQYFAPERKPAEGEWLAQLEARKTFLGHRLEADRADLEEWKARGWKQYSREAVHAGDVINPGSRGWGGNAEVVRVSAKSVSVRNRYGSTDRIGYDLIVRVDCPHREGADAP